MDDQTPDDQTPDGPPSDDSKRRYDARRVPKGDRAHGPHGAQGSGNTRGDSHRQRNAPGRPARSGDRKPWEKRDGAAPGRKPWQKRDDDASDGRASASRPSNGRPSNGRRSNGTSSAGGGRPTSGKPAAGQLWQKRGGRPSGGSRDGAKNAKKLWTRDGAPARGDRDAHRREQELTEQERLHYELKSVRPRHQDPVIPDDVTAEQLDRIARNELKTLSKDNADGVARHLVMAARLIDEDPALAHEHAISAARRAGRIAMVRETLAITAYGVGDFALALRELRTYRRISGSNNQLPLMVDSERGVGRPDRALELGRSVDRSTLPNDVQAALAIAMSGARLDQGDAQAALVELEIPQLDPDRAFSYSPDLYFAYAEVLEELGRLEEAVEWRSRADRAETALAAAAGDADDETVEVVEEDFNVLEQDADLDMSDERIQGDDGVQAQEE